MRREGSTHKPLMYEVQELIYIMDTTHHKYIHIYIYMYMSTYLYVSAFSLSGIESEDAATCTQHTNLRGATRTLEQSPPPKNARAATCPA